MCNVGVELLLLSYCLGIYYHFTQTIVSVLAYYIGHVAAYFGYIQLL